MKEVAAGAMAMMYVVGGLFFLRFWKRTRDVLFAFFAVAFWLLAAQRIALALSGPQFENSSVFYAARLIAFLLILVAIVQKNRSKA